MWVHLVPLDLISGASNIEVVVSNYSEFPPIGGNAGLGSLGGGSLINYSQFAPIGGNVGVGALGGAAQVVPPVVEARTLGGDAFPRKHVYLVKHKGREHWFDSDAEAQAFIKSLNTIAKIVAETLTVVEEDDDMEAIFLLME